MPEQDANLLEILIGQITQDRDINSVLGKALSVLPKTKLLKPIRNLLHRGYLRIERYPFWTGRPKGLRHAPTYCVIVKL
jgi:hypothetical protein